MPLNADKALLIDSIASRLGAQSNRGGEDILLGMMRRGVGRFNSEAVDWGNLTTRQTRLIRAMQYVFVEYEKGRQGNDLLTYSDVARLFRRAWIKSLRRGDRTYRLALPSPIAEVP